MRTTFHSKVYAIVLGFALIASGKAHGQSQFRAGLMPFFTTPTSGGDEIILNLPGDVPLVLERNASVSAGFCPPETTTMSGQLSSETTPAKCYVARDPLTYRQWEAVMASSGFPGSVMDNSEMSLDEPIRGLTSEDISGVKGFLPALEAYRAKLLPDWPLKFSMEPFPSSAGGSASGFRLVALMAGAKMLRPITEAACGLGGAQSLACNQTKSGSLSSTDCTLSDGSYADVYAFQGTAGDQITIDMASSAFDTYLILWNSAGTKVDEDDDSGAGTNSQITYTLTSTGTWYVGANSLSVGDTGGYTLTLHCGGSGNNCPILTISCGAQLSGTLSASDCLLADGSYADLYQFAGTSGQVATIDLTSGAFDTYLVLSDPGGNIVAVDDDSGVGTDSRISYTLTQSGNWLLAANSLQSGVIGSYGLHLACTTGSTACNYTIGTSAASFSSAAGTGSLQVSGTPGGCSGSWSAQSNVSWITLTGSNGGSGGGTFNVSYSVGSNPSSSSRSGTMTIAGRTFTVTQSGTTTTACVPSSTRACLLNGRFSATLRYRAGFDNNPADQNAQVKAVTGFANPNFETAFFYFNSDTNIEVLLKMLDQGNTDSQQRPTIAVLFGTATPLRAELTITDTATGTTRTFSSDFGAMRGTTDFTAFLK
jgi:hypothetical protein